MPGGVVNEKAEEMWPSLAWNRRNRIATDVISHHEMCSSSSSGCWEVAAAVGVGAGAVVGRRVLALSCAGTRSWLGLGLGRCTLPPAAG